MYVPLSVGVLFLPIEIGIVFTTPPLRRTAIVFVESSATAITSSPMLQRVVTFS
jgi:hypothetical protein